MGKGILRRKLEAAHFDLILFEEAPPDTDLENDCMRGPEAESTDDSSIWARTSLEALLDLIGDLPVHVAAAVRYKLTPAWPGHVVVFGPNGFHLLVLLPQAFATRNTLQALLRRASSLPRLQVRGSPPQPPLRRQQCPHTLAAIA